MSTQREHASHAGLLPRLLLRLNLHGKRKLIAAVVAVCVLFLLVLPYYRDGGYNASMVRSIASKDDPGPGVKKPTVKSAKGAASTLLRSQLNEARRKVTSLQQALSSCNASAATTTKEVAGKNFCFVHCFSWLNRTGCGTMRISCGRRSHWL